MMADRRVCPSRAVLLAAAAIVLAGMASTDPLVDFVLSAKSMATAMPKSYEPPIGFWRSINSQPNDPACTAERIIASYGLNIYDGACFQIAATLGGFFDHAHAQTVRLKSGMSGNVDIVAQGPTFTYGERSWTGAQPYFMRTITDQYVHNDPMTNKIVDWMDWKPITGENAWATLIGPLQSLYIAKGKANIRYTDLEIQLAVGHLPVFKAMQSQLGGLYYAAHGTPEVSDFTEISVENNASVLAGLNLLRDILTFLHDPEGLLPLVDDIRSGILRFLRETAFDKQDIIFVQGGVIANGHLVKSRDFAVDVQSWGLSVLGQQLVDSWFGQGVAYMIWIHTKRRSGVFNAKGELLGVGYTDGHSIISAEWTFGAINMCRILSQQYQSIDSSKAEILRADAASMLAGVQSLRHPLEDKTVSFLYANQRYRIPFSGGWWANPVPSMASTAWAVMINHGFNPFILEQQPIVIKDDSGNESRVVI